MRLHRKFVSWRRVSTKKQGRSGLGLEAQKTIIDYFVKQNEGTIIEDFCEVYTGKELNNCTELRKAIQLAKKENAWLIIAKTDRFRNCREALEIYEEMNGKILFCDLPHTDKFTLTLFFALAEREALLVSIRTKQALAVKRAQGVQLGRPKGTSLEVANQASSIRLREGALNDPTNKAVWAVCVECTKNHTERSNENFQKAINMLNEMGVKTRRGLDWDLSRIRSAYHGLRRIHGLGLIKQSGKEV